MFVGIEANDIFPVRRDVCVWFFALEALVSVTLVAADANVVS